MVERKSPASPWISCIFNLDSDREGSRGGGSTVLELAQKSPTTGFDRSSGWFLHCQRSLLLRTVDGAIFCDCGKVVELRADRAMSVNGAFILLFDLNE